MNSNNNTIGLSFSFLGSLRSEFIKFRSLKAMRILLSISIVGVLADAFMSAMYSETIWGKDQAVELYTIFYVIVISILSGKVITDEFESNTIVSTLLAIRSRATLVWSKAIMLFISMTIFTIFLQAISCLLQVFVIEMRTQTYINLLETTNSYSPIYIFVLLPLATAMLAIFAFAIGLISKSSSLTTFIILLYTIIIMMVIVPIAGSILPQEVVDTLLSIMPTSLYQDATMNFFERAQIGRNFSVISPDNVFYRGWLLLTIYVIISLLIGISVFKKRDV
jgi:ABC-type transport system involved in multi-copper enzyme maturation permease subunit